MRICTISINYKGASDTVEFLQSLASQEGVTSDLLVVDNGSGGDDIDVIQTAFPVVEVLKASTNLGFAAGNNLAFRIALERNYDYLFCINNDTHLEPDCLNHLIRCAETNRDAAIVAPLMYFDGDRRRPWFTGSHINMLDGTTNHVEADVRSERRCQPFEVPWITGCAMLIRSTCIREVGAFDERFFCYYEDVDLSMRMRRAGYRLLLCPEAVIYHKVSSSEGNSSLFRSYYSTRNQLLFFAKHNRGFHRTRVIWAISMRLIISLLRDLKYNRGRLTAQGRVSLCGLIDFFLRRFGFTYTAMLA